MLDDGNTLYRREKYDDAAHRYQYAIRRLPESFEGMEASEETFCQLKTHLLLNLSRCRRKQGQFADSVSKATDVLNLKPDCLEALHARARYVNCLFFNFHTTYFYKIIFSFPRPIPFYDFALFVVLSLFMAGSPNAAPAEYFP